MISDSHKIYEEMNYVLTLKEIGKGYYFNWNSLGSHRC